MYVHINNAFEDRGDVVVDRVRYNNYREFFDPARDFRAPSEIGGFASRLRITKGDKVTIVDVSEQGGSTLFPGFHGSFTNRVAAPAPNLL